MATFTRQVRLPVGVEEAFAWHERPGALDRLSPPWQPVTVTQPPDGIEVGTRVVLRLGIGRASVPWVAEHVAYDPPHEFRDVQRSGPFASWDHRHQFTANGEDSSTMTDEVTYELPLGPVGSTVAGQVVRGQLEQMFGYRHRQTVADLSLHATARERGVRPMHVAITGATGLIGTQLSALLTTGGHRVSRMTRGSADGDDEMAWDPQAETVDTAGLGGVDAVIHLAGEPIGKRFTAEHKRKVMDSRVKGTRAIATALAGMADGPRTLISSSAIGYYGADRDEPATEESPSGTGFLAEVCRAWEDATAPAEQAGVRVVHVRTGIVQSPDGGMLGQLLPLFRLGVGGKLGDGSQWVSWITLDDEVGLYHHALTTASLDGPLNAVAPNPVTNAEFAETLGKVLGRPTIVPVPAFAPAVLLGREGADQVAMASQHVLPAKAQATGYQFRHSTLEQGLRHLLGKA